MYRPVVVLMASSETERKVVGIESEFGDTNELNLFYLSKRFVTINYVKSKCSWEKGDALKKTRTQLSCSNQQNSIRLLLQLVFYGLRSL